MFRAIHPHEVHDELMSLKTNKSSIDIPRTCLKLAADHINEALMIVFNYSLLQSVFPEIFKISKVTPVDKGEKTLTPQIIARFRRCLLLPKYLKSLSVSNLLVI